MYEMRKNVLDDIVARLNKKLSLPTNPVQEDDDGTREFVPGVFHLSIVGRRYDLVRVDGKNGGVMSVFCLGHQTAETLYKMIIAFMEGIDYEN